MQTRNSYRATHARAHVRDVASVEPADSIKHGTVAATMKQVAQAARKFVNPFAPRRSGNKPPWNKVKK